MSALEQVMASVDALPRKDQAALASYLLDKLEPDHDSELSDEQWQAEIARRNAEIRAGTAIGRPIEEFIEELKK